MPNLQGLAIGAGAAQGIASGVDAFFRTKTQLNEEAIKKQLANSQTLEAYSKLADVVGTDRADDLFREKGLISPQPQGILPQPANMGSVNPNIGAANQGMSTAAGSPGSPLAPSSPNQSKIDDSQSQTGSGSLWSPEQQGEFYKKLRTQDKYTRQGLLATNQVHLDPQKNVEYNNALAQPTYKAMDYVKDPAMQMKNADVAFKNIHKALDQGGEMTPAAVLRWLPQVLNPANPRPGDIPEAFDMDPKARTEINNAISKKLTGDFSPETKAAIRKVINNAYQNQTQAYSTLVGQAGKSFGTDAKNLQLVDLSEGKGLMKRTSPEAPSPVGGLLLGGGGRSAMAGQKQNALPSSTDVLKEIKARGLKLPGGN